MDPFVLKVLGAALIFTGLADLVIVFTVFRKKLAVLEAEMTPFMPPEQLHPLQRQVKGQRLIIQTIQSTGVLFMAAGLYLLAR